MASLGRYSWWCARQQHILRNVNNTIQTLQLLDLGGAIAQLPARFRTRKPFADSKDAVDNNSIDALLHLTLCSGLVHDVSRIGEK